jgi:hypothetical protein
MKKIARPDLAPQNFNLRSKTSPTNERSQFYPFFAFGKVQKVGKKWTYKNILKLMMDDFHFLA